MTCFWPLLTIQQTTTTCAGAYFSTSSSDHHIVPIPGTALRIGDPLTLDNLHCVYWTRFTDVPCDYGIYIDAREVQANIPRPHGFHFEHGPQKCTLTFFQTARHDEDANDDECEPWSDAFLVVRHQGQRVVDLTARDCVGIRKWMHR